MMRHESAERLRSFIERHTGDNVRRASLLADVEILEGFSRRSISARDAGALGGHARAASLDPERRSEIARAAARARWGGNR